MYAYTYSSGSVLLLTFFHLSACFTGNWAQPNHNLRIRHYCYVTAIIEACIFLWQRSHIYLFPQATSDTSM